MIEQKVTKKELDKYLKKGLIYSFKCPLCNNIMNYSDESKKRVWHIWECKEGHKLIKHK